MDRWAAYEGDDPQSKIDGVRAIYDAVGVREMSEKLIGSYFADALKKLDYVHLPESRKQALKEYAGSLINRVL